jgi:hypothetical protein
MFSDDYLQYDAALLAFVTRDEAEEKFAQKSDIPTLSGGLSTTTGDARYAPITGSTVYATVAQIPDVSGKANVSDVATALNAKANITDVTTALAGKADAGHLHTGTYAPVSTTYTKTEVDTAVATKAASNHTHTGI